MFSNDGSPQFRPPMGGGQGTNKGPRPGVGPIGGGGNTFGGAGQGDGRMPPQMGGLLGSGAGQAGGAPSFGGGLMSPPNQMPPNEGGMTPPTIGSGTSPVLSPQPSLGSSMPQAPIPPVAQHAPAAPSLNGTQQAAPMLEPPKPSMPAGLPPGWNNRQVPGQGGAPVNGAPASRGMSPSLQAQNAMMKRANVKPAPYQTMPPKPNA